MAGEKLAYSEKARRQWSEHPIKYITALYYCQSIILSYTACKLARNSSQEVKKPLLQYSRLKPLPIDKTMSLAENTPNTPGEETKMGMNRCVSVSLWYCYQILCTMFMYDYGRAIVELYSVARLTRGRFLIIEASKLVFTLTIVCAHQLWCGVLFQ